jgi:putative N-acetylmannosamine-6-phosphate epimerase
MTANVNTDSEQKHIVYRHADGSPMHASDWLSALVLAAPDSGARGMAGEDADAFIQQFTNIPYEDEV